MIIIQRSLNWCSMTVERERGRTRESKNILPDFCSPSILEQNFQHSNPVFSWNKNKIKSVPNRNKSVQGHRILGYSFNQQWNKTFQNFLSNKIKHLTQKEMPIKHKFYSLGLFAIRFISSMLSHCYAMVVLNTKNEKSKVFTRS